jgi:hypothetical protein
MKTRLTLKPGQRGTRKLVEEYGDRLLYVRYKYDAQRKRRIKSVEIIVEEVPWAPRYGRLLRDTVVAIQVTAREVALQKRVKAVGGQWNPEKKLWELAYKHVVELGLEDRMVVDTNPIGAEKHPL